MPQKVDFGRYLQTVALKETERCGEWNSMLGLGNPAASPEVQKYLKASTEEQLQAGITPKQAVPLFLPILLLLARFLNRKIAAHSINSVLVCLFWLEIKPFSKHYSSAVIVVLILEWCKQRKSSVFPRTMGYIVQSCMGENTKRRRL